MSVRLSQQFGRCSVARLTIALIGIPNCLRSTGKYASLNACVFVIQWAVHLFSLGTPLKDTPDMTC
jgi:hypothetical protein